MFNLIDKEIERCHSLTNGCGFSMLIEAFKLFLKNYIEEFKRVVVNLKERKNEANQAFVRAHSRTSSKVGVSGAGLTSSNANGEEDWDTFRHFVKIIQIVGDLMIKYESLEENLDKQIQNCFIHKPNRHLSLSGSNPINSPAKAITPTQPQKSFQFDSQSQAASSMVNLISINNYKNYLLNDLERIKLNTLISIIESGNLRQYKIKNVLNLKTKNLFRG